MRTGLSFPVGIKDRRRTMFIRKAMLFASFALCAIAVPAGAQVGIGFSIGVAPPPPRYEVVPAPREGYYWAPGYWRWGEPRRSPVWVEGSWGAARPGHPSRGKPVGPARPSHCH